MGGPLHGDAVRRQGGRRAGRPAPRRRRPAAPGQCRQRPGQWLTVGGTWNEQRFSPLSQINDKNVGRLGLAWYADLNTYRGVEATPLIIDGVLYNISAWDITTAYDAATGKVLWTFDPKIAGRMGAHRLLRPGQPGPGGLARQDHHRDPRRAADRAGRQDRQAGLERADPRAGPAAVHHRRAAHRRRQVVIGNGGGDFGARGYMSAYDADTGKPPGSSTSCPATRRRAGRRGIRLGHAHGRQDLDRASGGSTAAAATTGTPSSTIPKLHLVYFGTGNGSPHPQKFRSPGGGDNLFLCSIVAVDAQTGQYAWHYQEIPGEEWDYDCTAPLILADLKIGGRSARSCMHAPKDGFFYVLDRATGKLISAKQLRAQHLGLAAST